MTTSWAGSYKPYYTHKEADSEYSSFVHASCAAENGKRKPFARVIKRLAHRALNARLSL